MAWTLKLLIWIAFITAEAYRCKHAFGLVGGLPYPYDYVNTEPLPDDRMNTRATQITSDVDIQDSSRVMDHQAYSKPYLSNRRAETNGNVVFPGPTSRRQPEPVIPEECKRTGYCTKVQNYPRHLADKLLTQVKPEEYHVDKLESSDSTPEITQRLGPQEENLELCTFEETVLVPEAAPDAHGEWNIVLNSATKPLQGFRAEICKPKANSNNTSCAPFVYFQVGYEGSCIQKFTFRQMTVIAPDGSTVEKSLKVPTCCSCIAKIKNT